MRSLLHILTQPEDELIKAVITGQRVMPDTLVEVCDLTGTTPDYEQAVEKIFRADSVAVW